MSELILHHYPQSPFAEKVRLIMGYKGLAWQSVKIPMILPKPELVALTGGYRRTPVLQVGADLYCDTALISNVLEQMAPNRSLYPTGQKGLVRVLAQWADSSLFQVAMAYNFQPEGAMQLFPDAEQLKVFGADRAAMRNNAPRMAPADATGAYLSYLRRIANMLEGQAWLCGEQVCLADFAVYHPLWFTRHQVPNLAGILATVPRVLDWMDRVAALGHGTVSNISAQQAIEMARAATPAPLAQAPHQDDHAIALGSAVTIAAESFGTEPTAGELVAATRTRYTLKRESESAASVHVHFPRLGFVLRRQEA
jgi:glutathione S-transferase